jgi:hypothetical protein
MSRIMLALAGLLLLVGGARAAEVTSAEPHHALPGAPGLTYADLLRQVLPDAGEVDGVFKGSEVIPLRHVGGPDMAVEHPAEYELLMIAATVAQTSGGSRRILLIDLDQGGMSAEGYVVLAMFDGSARPELIDAAQINYDRSTHFYQQAVLPVSAGDSVILSISTHFNSSQGYVTVAMIMPRDDRFELVDTVFAFEEQGCGYDWTQTPGFRAGEQAADRRYADIVATVTETIAHKGEACDGIERPAERRREITVTYRWDAAAGRYLPDSDAFETLAAENEQRF